MNVLETFFYLFKSDTSDLERGSKVVDKTQKDSQEKIKKTNEDTQDLAASFLDLATKAAALIGVTLTAGAAINSLFGTEKQALNIGFFADSTGVAVGQVDALTQATLRYGGTLQGTLATIQKVQEGLTFFTPYGGSGDGTAMPTDFAIKARQFGISVAPGMQVQDVFDQLHNRFKNQAPNVNAKIGAALGFDPATIRMLQTSDEEYKRIRDDVEQIGLLTEKNTKAAQEFYMKWGDINQIIREFQLILGTDILDFFNRLPELIEKNKVQIESLTEALKIFGIVAAVAMIPLIVDFLILAAPLIIAVALFGALYLAIYRIKTGFAWFFKEMKAWGQDVVDIFKDLYGWVSKIVTTIEGFNPFGSKSKPSAAGQSEKDQFDQEELLYRSQMALRHASSNPFSSRPGSSSNSSSTSVHIREVNVHTQATDADGVASAVGGALHKEINNTINNYNTGVHA